MSSESNSPSDISDTESMGTIDYESSDSMLVEQVKELPAETSVGTKCSVKVKRSKRDWNMKGKIKTLLSAIAEMF